MAHISLLIKTFEELVKKQVFRYEQDKLDPLQFSAQVRRKVEDATAALLYRTLRHPEENKDHPSLISPQLLYIIYVYNPTSLHKGCC